MSDSLAVEREADSVGQFEETVTGRQLWLVAGGIVVILAGLLTFLFPFGPVVPPNVITLVGTVSLLLCLYLVLAWPLLGTEVTESPRVHRREGVRLTGTRFEERVWRTNVTEDDLVPVVRDNVRSELERLAHDVLVTETGVDSEEAAQQLADGTWTDDEVAARFLQSEAGKGVERSRTSVPGRQSFERRIERTVDAIANLALDSDGRDGTRDWVDTSTGDGTGGSVGAGISDGTGDVVDDTDSRAGDGVGDLKWLETPFEPADEQQWPGGLSETDAWRGIGVFALFALGIAALFQRPGLALVAGLLLGVAGYTRAMRVPETRLAVTREFDTRDPRPGDSVTVTVTVANEGESVLSDVRIVDDVPDRLAVVDGSPRYATALGPGESITYTYDVLAVYGEHEFDAVHVATRDVSGHQERTETLETEPATLVCEPGVVRESVPLHPQATGVTGRVPSDVGGSGQEFRSIREYRRGDPLRRVDWNRVARTGDLATLQFREEHAATVVLLVDARTSTFRSPAPNRLSAVDRSLAGASQLFTTLERDGDRVGLASIGTDWLWHGPSAGSDHRARIRAALQHDPAFVPSDEGYLFEAKTYVSELRRRLPSDAQVVVFSPLLDDEAVDVIRRIHAHGYQLTVFSPDPTETDYVGGMVARLWRRVRIRTLRDSGIHLVDWTADESLERAVVRTGRRRSP